MSGEPRIIPVGGEPPPLLTADELAGRDTRPSGRREPATADKAKKSAGRWAMLNYFGDVTARTLPTLAVAVWLQLFRNAKSDGLVRLSQVELARRVGKSKRSVFSALRRLESVGVLTVVHRGSLNAGPSTYRVRARREDDR
jgi:hypothetical protein